MPFDSVDDYWNWLPAYQVGLREHGVREDRKIDRERIAAQERISNRRVDEQSAREERIEAYQRRMMELAGEREKRLETQQMEAARLRAQAEERLAKKEADEFKFKIGEEFGFTGRQDVLPPEQANDQAFVGGVASGRMKRTQAEIQQQDMIDRITERLTQQSLIRDDQMNRPPVVQEVPEAPGVVMINGRPVQIDALNALLLGAGGVGGSRTNAPPVAAPSTSRKYDKTGKRIQ